METDQTADVFSIKDLPDEIIITIILYNEVPDLVNFSSTCKRFRDIIIKNNVLWKRKFAHTLGEDCQKKFIKYKGDINWLREHEKFYEFKKCINSELVSLSSRLFRLVNNGEYLWENFSSVFNIATKTELNFYYTVFALQENIRKTYKLLEKNCSKYQSMNSKTTSPRPFTSKSDQCNYMEIVSGRLHDVACHVTVQPRLVYSLTTTYYARIILGHLIQSFLCIKWVEKELQESLTPIFVIMFFVQWIDPIKLYLDEEVEEKIKYLLVQVEDLLAMKGNYTELEVIECISDVIFKKEQIIMSNEVNIQTLNIIEVILNKRGSNMAIVVLYQTLATRLGRKCVLCRAHPYRKLCVEWVSKDKSEKYIIDITTGKTVTGSVNVDYHLSPGHRGYFKEFLECMQNEFIKALPLQDWVKRNFNTLLEFLYIVNPIGTFVQTVNNTLTREPPPQGTFIDIKWMTDTYRTIIERATNLETWCPNLMVIKKRMPEIPIKYAIGMVCCHILRHCTCVIRDWRVNYEQKNVHNTIIYPIYTIIMEDGTEELLPKDLLMCTSKPTRVPFIEDLLGRHFSHFDGFVYVPNEVKMLEYPDELSVINYYKNYCMSKRN